MRLQLLALLLLTMGTANAVSRREAVENAQKLTVIVTNEGFTKGGRGTGFILDSRHVVTCAHMVQSPEDVLYVYTYPLGLVVTASVEQIDIGHDVALLRLDTPVALPSKPKFNFEVYDGEPILIIGNALGSMHWIVSVGIISGQDRGSLLTDANVNPGNSGGPWLNEDGEIIGITAWRIGPVEHRPGIAGAISMKTIADCFLRWAKQ